jgi:hypothetical protein
MNKRDRCGAMVRIANAQTTLSGVAIQEFTLPRLKLGRQHSAARRLIQEGMRE